MRFLLVDPPHKIWTILRAWVPSPGCLQLLAYLEREGFDVDYMDSLLMKILGGTLKKRSGRRDQR